MDDDDTDNTDVRCLWCDGPVDPWREGEYLPYCPDTDCQYDYEKWQRHNQ